MTQVTIDGGSLTLEQLVQVARENALVRIDADALARTSRGKAALDRLLSQNSIIYGVNTGFGALSDSRIAPEEQKQLQSNLIRSHAVSVGQAQPTDAVRAIMLLRANTLLKGYSGIRPEIPQTIVRLLNKRIHPYVPEKGSVGASGDLSPLSHISLVLMGEGKAESEGRWLPGKEALKKGGITSLVFEAKEGLALNNGTQQMLSVGSLALNDSYTLLLTSVAALAVSLEALNGWIDAFDEKIHGARPHPGQKTIAQRVRALLAGSRMVRSISHNNQSNGRPQDPYSFRCAPQVMGAVDDALGFVKQVLETEMNSATDNPLVFPEESVVLSGGNFHGQPVSMALDFLALAVSNLANLSERRMSALLDPSLNNGLPPFLVGRGSKPGLASGLMAVQYTATALVAENKILTHPASSDSIPTSSNFEDFVSMGPGAAYKARAIVDNAQYVIAVELLTAAQGVDLRETREQASGTRRVCQLLRRHVPVVTEDRSLHGDIEKTRSIVREGKFAEIALEYFSKPGT